MIDRLRSTLEPDAAPGTDRYEKRCLPMLWVYELEGKRYPGDVPQAGLAGIWPEAGYCYLFYRKDALPEILEWLASRPAWRLTSRYNLPLSRWQDAPARQIIVGPFAIRPPCPIPAAAPSGKILLNIDPGIVFGSGIHPTTQGCLLALSDLFKRERIRTVVDFGTGTGILAAACARLGAESVWAADANPAAIRTARDNVAANGLSDRIRLIAADTFGALDARPDLLVMNIEWPIMERILSAGDWRSSRWVILSGFLQGVLKTVEREAGPDFRTAAVSICRGWPVLTLERARI